MMQVDKIVKVPRKAGSACHVTVSLESPLKKSDITLWTKSSNKKGIVINVKKVRTLEVNRTVARWQCSCGMQAASDTNLPYA